MSEFFYIFALGNFVYMSMRLKRILFIAQDIFPYSEESMPAMLGRMLAHFAQEKGCEIRTFMPKWGTVNERRSQLHEVIRLSGMNLIIDDTDHMLIIKVASIPSARIQVYFIDNDDYFNHRGQICDSKGKEYTDNAERAIFYARGVMETIVKLRWVPDVIHCQGWASVIAPLYVKTKYREEPSFRDAKVIFTPTIHELKHHTRKQFLNNLACQDIPQEIIEQMPAKQTLQDLYKLAIKYSDAFMTTSENDDEELKAYAKELGLPVLGPVDPQAEGAKDVIFDFFDSLREDIVVVDPDF